MISLFPALAEPGATALLLTIFGAMTALSVLASRAVDRAGVPIVLLFLVLGMFGGSEGLGVEFANYQFAVRLGTTTLILILFDGGLNTSLGSIRQALAPAGILSTLGVAATAGLTAAFVRLLGMPWAQAWLLGAIVSSTDAAAVFAILRGGNLQLRPRIASVIEVESCVNDPMAVILTMAFIHLIAGGQTMSWRVLLDVPLQLLIGTAIGLWIGFCGRFLLRHVRLASPGLYPALTFAIALSSFGLATLLQGSGFLAVYATAVLLGSGSLPYRSGLTRIHDALGWLSQIAMFLMLGLLVKPSNLLPVAGVGLAVGLFLAIIARPLATLPCLMPFGYSFKESAYIGWVGLRGAVPIVLATFPVLANVPQADRIFNIVFFVVVVSSIVPGATVRRVTQWLKLTVAGKPMPPAVLEINSWHPLKGELVSFFIDPAVAVCGASLADVEFPAGSAVVLVVRGQDLIAARGNTTLEAGDHVYVFFKPDDRPVIELLFGRPENGS